MGRDDLVKSAVLVLVGGLFGALLGVVLMPRAPATPVMVHVPRPIEPVRTTPVPEPEDEAAPEGVVVEERPPAVPVPVPFPEESASACPVCFDERAALTEQIVELTEQLVDYESGIIPEGAEERDLLEPPEEAQDDRFQQAALVEAWQQAYDETEVPGDVENVDCSEYPCIVYGSLRRHEDLAELLRAPSFGSYEGDSHFDGVVSRRLAPQDAEGGPSHIHYYGSAYYPSTDDSEQRRALRRRFDERMWEMLDDMAESGLD